MCKDDETLRNNTFLLNTTTSILGTKRTVYFVRGKLFHTYLWFLCKLDFARHLFVNLLFLVPPTTYLSKWFCFIVENRHTHTSLRKLKEKTKWWSIMFEQLVLLWQWNSGRSKWNDEMLGCWLANQVNLFIIKRVIRV